MKKVILHSSLLLMVAFFAPVRCGGIVDQLEQVGQVLRKPGDLFVGVIEEKKQQLAELQKLKTELEETEKDFLADIKRQVDGVNARIQQVKSELIKSPEDEFLNKKQFILSETYQILQDVIRTREQANSLLDDFIKQLSELFQDPDFANYKKVNKLVERLYYSFEDLQKIHEMVLDQGKRVAQLADQEKNAKAELEGRKRSAAATLEQIKKKQEELKAATQEMQESTQELALEVAQNNELLRAEEQLYSSKKVLDTLRLQEIRLKIDFFALQLFVAKSERDLIKEYLRKIKPSVRVSEADIAYAKDEFDKWKQEYYKTKESYRQEAVKLRELQKKKEQQLKGLSEQRNVSLGRELDEWTQEPAQAVDAYLAFCEVGTLNAALLELNKKLELFEAQIALEDEKLNYETLQVQVKESYHKVSTRKITSDEEIAKEIKQYDAPRAEAKAKELRYKETLGQLGDLLSTQKKVLDNITQRRQELQKFKTTLFKVNQKEYVRCLELFNQAEQYVKNQIDTLSKLTGTYSGVVAVIADVNRIVSFIKGELEAITIWHRPEYAITLQGVKGIGSDIVTFLSDIRAYIIRFDIGIFFGQIKEPLRQPWQLFILILKLLGLLFVLFILRRYIAPLNALLLRISQEYAGLIHWVSMLFVLLFRFAYKHFLSLVIWFTLFAFLRFSFIPDPYLYAIFYLCSIPYLLYLSYRFIRFLIHFNTQHEYALLAQDFQGRFILVFSTLLYATVTISLFKEAFMLANYYKSELPTILLAVNYIILQISLLFLISKEQILNLIPTKNELWRWIYDKVDNYYYLYVSLLVVAIIISNPYVGFGRLVLHIFFGFIYTGLLLVGLIWVHALFKRIASRVFFSIDQDMVRERFSHAKTWFGLLIIVAFVVFTCLGVLIGARIWGWQFNFADITALFHEPILGKDTATPITTFSLLQIITFILAGFLISYAISRFVLDKIFDLLLVDTGVQHTVTSIMQYIVVTLAVFIGFQSVGLGQVVTYLILALSVSIGWVLKEPISDFISYFIILMQRPIKIGDYIQIDDETKGVVRKITARSIVLRRKNSTIIVVPNSIVTGKALVNWNYTRNFIAFNDIMLIVMYKADPAKVKELLHETVDAHPNILKNPPSIVRLEGFGEYGYEFLVRAFLSSVYTLEQWNIASDIRLAIVKTLHENNIELAVPVRIIKTAEGGYKKDKTGAA